MDHETEDKIIGGKLTLRQGLYLSVTVIYFASVFLYHEVYTPMWLAFKISSSTIILTTCLLLAFVKRKDYYLDHYYFKKFRFLLRNKSAVYRKY